MANLLRTEKKLAVLAALVAVRSTERLTGVHRDTICRLLSRVGAGCSAILDDRMINLPVHAPGARRAVVVRRKEAAHRAS